MKRHFSRTTSAAEVATPTAKLAIIALVAALAAAAAGAEPIAARDRPAAYAADASETRVALPFSFVSMNAKYHVIAWFDGHPEFEAVEAFVYGENRIHAILTKHDNSQIDVFTPSSTECPVARERESYTGKCSFSLAQNGRDAELIVQMPDGHELALSYAGQSAPDPRYGGLTDPGRHAPDGGLPAFVREASSVSGKKSSVRIGTARYDIPIDGEISKPPFFTAYRAFLSVNYASMIIPTVNESDREAILADAVGTAKPGYRTDVTDNEVSVSMRGKVAEVAAISCSSPEISAPGYHADMLFDPPFPNLYAMQDGETATSRFAITFGDDAKEEIYGTVQTEKNGDSVTVRLRPEYPAWAKVSRAIIYSAVLTESGLRVSSAMDEQGR